MIKERIPTFTAAVAATALLAPAAHAKPAPPTTVHCGQVITKSIRVANDLSGCAAAGLVVGAPRVTIDLNGHTIAGTDENVVGGGVTSDGFDGTVVRNGTVRNFWAGVRIANANGGVVERMRAIDNLQGYLTEDASRVTISRSSATGGQMGVNLVRTVDSVVSRVTTSGNEQGVVLNQGSTRNLVERNHFAGTDTGVTAAGAFGNTISRNSGDLNVFGARLSFGSPGNLLVRNDFTRSTQNGIWVEDAPDTILRDNRVTRAAADGILVSAPSAGSVLTRNGAFNNGQLGINAEAPVVDGGGNRASGNGDPRQCVGVTCRR